MSFLTAVGEVGQYRIQDVVQDVFVKKLAYGPARHVVSLADFQNLVCAKWLKDDKRNRQKTLDELARQTRLLAETGSAYRALNVLAYFATACGAHAIKWPNQFF